MQKNASFIIANAHGSVAFSRVTSFTTLPLPCLGWWELECWEGVGCENIRLTFSFLTTRKFYKQTDFCQIKVFIITHHGAGQAAFKYFCFNLFLHKISCKQKQINFPNCLFQLPVSAFFKQDPAATFRNGKMCVLWDNNNKIFSILQQFLLCWVEERYNSQSYKVSWRISEKTLVQVGSLIVIFIFIPDLGQLLMDL